MSTSWRGRSSASLHFAARGMIAEPLAMRLTLLFLMGGTQVRLRCSGTCVSVALT
jgi:hypothetical protein